MIDNFSLKIIPMKCTENPHFFDVEFQVPKEQELPILTMLSQTPENTI